MFLLNVSLSHLARSYLPAAPFVKEEKKKKERERGYRKCGGRERQMTQGDRKREREKDFRAKEPRKWKL